MAKRAWSGAALVVSLFGLLAVVLLDRLAPFPSADVARGSEEAFTSDLELRELVGAPRRPQRWTRDRALVRFANLPGGSRALEVALHQHRQPIVVAVDGAIVGSLPPRVNSAEFVLPPSPRSSVSVELRTETFAAGGGRELGALLDRVRLRHARSGLPALGLFLGGLGVALGVLAAAGLAGAAPIGAAALALLALCCYAALLWPMGLLRSSYSVTLPALILCGAALACAFARWRRTPWAFVALLCAWLVQGIAMTSPMAVMSDAVLHANKVMQVAGGDLFPVSLTQHARPFQFPYGVSFYALLSPLFLLGFDPVALVRYGAGVSGALSAVPLFLIGERAPARAALAVLVLQALPISCDTFAYGNLSNIFGQAITLALLAWWLFPRGGALLGALLLLAAALAHLSSLIVLAVLVPMLFLLGAGGRVRVLAASLAAVFVLLYYSHFLPLIAEQLPRLAEGGGSGRRSLSVFEAILTQAQDALGRWGWPAVFLAALGLPRPSRGEPDRLLTAVWAMGALLAIVAAISPIEVRYLHAMGFAVSLAAAHGCSTLFQRGKPTRLAACCLLGWQAVLALQGMQEILLSRYRL